MVGFSWTVRGDSEGPLRGVVRMVSEMGNVSAAGLEGGVFARKCNTSPAVDEGVVTAPGGGGGLSRGRAEPE